MTIRVLSGLVASQIAAGEVVERPASVVKELIENSLDAGARRITVEIRVGGVESIRVVDDGVGMPAEEVALALQRHATSKLATAEELAQIATLGFRGEALPSIAAVSRFHLVSRPEGAEIGWEVKLPWGESLEEGPQGCPPGTTVTVSDLFHNVPARRKFLRSPAAEAGRIAQQVSNFVMAYPEVRFHLRTDGRDTIQSPGNGSQEDALTVVFGAGTTAQMLRVEAQFEGGYAVEGYVSPPSLHRANRRNITLFINRRWSYSRMLSVALEESYHGLLPQGRYPMAVLDVTVPLDELDVNVHPTKREVRFLHQDRAFSAVQRSVRAALLAQSPVPQVIVPQAPGSHRLDVLDFQAPLFSARRGGGGRRAEEEPGGGPPMQRTVTDSNLRVLGQAGSTYVVAEGPDGIFLIDQHAAHERVLYERVLKSQAQSAAEVQTLLEPVTVELSPAEVELLEAAPGDGHAFGFVLEPFGGDAYLLRGVPAVFRDSDPSVGLREVLELAAKETRIKDRREVLAASVACHSAVRAGLSLTDDEMREMISLLEATENPHTCPHGRPTMLHLSSQQLARQFGRS